MSVRLLANLTEHWENFDGYAVSHGMPDLRTLPLERLCNFVYYQLTRGAEQAEIDKFRARLWKPPRGMVPDKRSPWSAENEAKAFAALASGLGMRPNSATSK